MIAVGIGVHNFGEGLAIGQAAAAGEISLAVTLIIGFGLHNATEGFGICGPMTGEGTQPSWRYLVLLGVIGGLPTFLGTALGQAWSSEAVSVVFFAVAAGSILYVVQELFAVNRLYGHPKLVTWLVLTGIVLGFATDFVDHRRRRLSRAGGLGPHPHPRVGPRSLRPRLSRYPGNGHAFVSVSRHFAGGFAADGATQPVGCARSARITARSTRTSVAAASKPTARSQST